MAGKKVVGATSGTNYTAVWTESGELSTFGYGVAGHGIDAHELSPRLVEALVGKVIGIGRSLSHSSMNGRSELFTFGQGSFGSLAHGGEENESVPRFVSAAPVSDCILHIAYCILSRCGVTGVVLSRVLWVTYESHFVINLTSYRT